MFSKLSRFLRLFFRRSRTINNEPLNKVSLVIIIVIDIFILTNVFIGLDDISQWHITPTDAYPCYAQWNDYRSQTAESKDFDIVQPAAALDRASLQKDYQQRAVDQLGEVTSLCVDYAEKRDAVRQPENTAILEALQKKGVAIASLENTNRTIRQQYDSTLLEKIAEQPRDQSINLTSAEQAKAKLTENEVEITRLKAEIPPLENELISNPESAAFLAFLKQDSAFQTVKRGYERAKFWYPSIQLIFQAAFLMPLILGALAAFTVAQNKRYGLIALISWHLLVIFFIPLIFRAFEFLQAGVIFNIVFDIITALFGQLLFLVSYVYILLIPLLGFGVIKLAQKFIFNPKLQAAGRVQNSRCIKCAKKIKAHDAHCPHCGYYQHRECGHCHQLTYKYLPYCNQCGVAQPIKHG